MCVLLNRKMSTPLHMQVRNILLDRITSQIYPVNEQIPSENDLSKEFGISRMTLRNVITELVWGGYLYRIQGKGTYVSEPKITARPTKHTGIHEQIEQMGYKVKIVPVGVELRPCTDFVKREMKLDGDEKVFSILRLRYVQGKPLSLDTSFIPKKFCPGMTLEDFGRADLGEILEKRCGLALHYAEETLEAISAGKEEAEYLSVQVGDPLLLLCDKIYDAENRLFEYSRVAFRGDNIRIKNQYPMEHPLNPELNIVLR